VQAAASAGAEIRDGERADRVVEDHAGVTIETQRGRMRVDVVVAADGDPSVVGRQLGLGGTARRRSLALNVDLPLTSALPADSAVLSFTVPGGYLWYFPKGDHASVGVGSNRAGARDMAAVASLRLALTSFAASLGLDISDGHVTGHWVPQGLRHGRLATRRVLLAGDAAATGDPLLGEGIAYAIISGVVASQTVADMDAGLVTDLRVYDARLRTLLGPPLRRLELATAGMQWSARLGLLALRWSPWVRTYAVDVVSGRQSPFALDALAESGSGSSLAKAYRMLRS
jgi:flavin-dependent dehydrogenase